MTQDPNTMQADSKQSDDEYKEELISDEEIRKVDFVKLIDQPEWKTILFEIVDKLKMDIWDIDISGLTQQYLEKIQSMQSTNLRVPANAILACSILLKTKSRTLKFSSIEPDPNEISEKERLELNELLPELTSSAKLREGAVTLDELVESIEEIIEKTKRIEGKSRRLPERTPDFGLLFDEGNIEEKIAEVFEKIKLKADPDGLVLFHNLLEKYSAIEVVNTFIPLLFLMNEGKVLMWQEKFFDEIFIRILEEKREIDSEGN